MKLTPRKAGMLAREEARTAKHYRAMGLPRIAAQEARHAAFFKMKAKGF